MKNPIDAVRCLQQLGSETDPRGASADQIARREGLDPQVTHTLLEELVERGLVAAAGVCRYRLARDPKDINVRDLVGGAGVRLGPTLADLLHWESQIFNNDSIARAA